MDKGVEWTGVQPARLVRQQHHVRLVDGRPRGVVRARALAPPHPHELFDLERRAQNLVAHARRPLAVGAQVRAPLAAVVAARVVHLERPARERLLAARAAQRAAGRAPRSCELLELLLRLRLLERYAAACADRSPRRARAHGLVPVKGSLGIGVKSPDKVEEIP